jgi:hypothetical protein
MNGIFYLVGLIVVALLVVYALKLGEERPSSSFQVFRDPHHQAIVRS